MRDSLREKLARLEHEQWMSWALTLLEEEQLSQTRAERWKMFLVPYDELPEFVKEFDREWADKVLAVINKYFRM